MRTLNLAACVLLMLTGLLAASCGGGKTLDGSLATNPAAGVPLSQQPDTQATLALPGSAPAFPNDKAAVDRQVSDDSVTLLGRDWHEKSDTAEEVGSTLELNGGDIAWGIYALGGFGEVQPGSVYASFFTEKDMPCRIYLGVADFGSGHWRWMDAGKDDGSFLFPADGQYTSPTGNCYVVVLRHLEGNAKLYELNIGRIGETDLESPAGFSATTDPGEVHLDWLPVAGATGYNVYRSSDRKFVNQIKINEDPVSTDAYDDSFVLKGQLYFYRVTAVAAIESEYSNSLSVFVPTVDAPAPQNLRAIDVGDDYFEIAWDWEGASPSAWFVYIANAPDFDFDPPTYYEKIPQGSARSWTFSELDPGRLYFVRMAASFSGAPGRMTDALPCLTGDQWEWFDIEEIGDGHEPVVAVIADDKICASYINDNVVHVARNSGAGQPWLVEGTALDKSLLFYNERIMEMVSAGGFTGELDIDYKDGTYLICSVTTHHNDFYTAIGAPGVGWDVELVDMGTTYDVLKQTPSAGAYCSAAISQNGYNVSGLDFYLDQYCHYTRALGNDKPWVKHEIRNVPQGLPFEFDLEVKNGSLFASCFDFTARQLFLWSEQDDFKQVTNNAPGVTFGLFTDLELLGDKWVSSAYHGADQDLYTLTDNGGEFWDSNIVTASDDYPTGRNVRLEPFRDGLVCVYMGGSTREWYCSVMHGDGSWETQLMKIGEIDAYEKCDLKVLNDRPVFVVADRITEKVYAIRGNIPQV